MEKDFDFTHDDNCNCFVCRRRKNSPHDMGKQKDLFGGEFGKNGGDIHKDGYYYADRDGMRAQNAQDRKVPDWNKEYKRLVIKYILKHPGEYFTSEDIMNWIREQGIEPPKEGRAVGPTWRFSQVSPDNEKAGRPAIVRFITAVRYKNKWCHKGFTSQYVAIPENIPAYIEYWGLS